MRLDHLVFAATDLASGTDWLSECLGCSPVGGGRHALMGTHNRLWRLGDAYLEMITVDPAAAPGRPRWYALDDASALEAGPRLWHWVVGVDDLSAARAAAPVDPGAPLRVTRDELYWDLTVPQDGGLRWEGVYPTLIQWPDDVVPPPARLEDKGLVLEALRAQGPADMLQDLRGLGVAGMIELSAADTAKLTARIARPDGVLVTF